MDIISKYLIITLQYVVKQVKKLQSCLT